MRSKPLPLAVHVYELAASARRASAARSAHRGQAAAYGWRALVGCVVVLAGLASVAATAKAQTPASRDAAAPAAPAPDAAPAPPAHDRVTMADGAIHEGTVTGAADGNLVLDAPEIGTLGIPLDKIGRVRLTGPHRLYAQAERAGPARAVTLDTDEAGELRYRTPGAPVASATRLADAPPYLMQVAPIAEAIWKANAATTFSLSRGNTDDAAIGILLQGSRETDADLFSLSYDFAYLETETTGTTIVSRRQHKFEALYRYFLSDRWGLFAKDHFQSDLIAGLRYRDTIDLGLSFTPVKTKTRRLTTDLAVTYTIEKETGLLSNEYLGATVALDAMQKLGDHVEITFTGSAAFDFGTPENYLLVGTLGLKNDLGGGISLILRLEDRYDNRPAPGFKANDLAITAILGIDFA